MQVSGDARYVTTPEGVKKIDAFYLHFNGIKVKVKIIYFIYANVYFTHMYI